MKAQILTATLLLTACGGPEEIGMTEDELLLQQACAYTDDVPNTSNCARPMFSGSNPKWFYLTSSSDTDWFYFKTNDINQPWLIWASNGSASTQCRLWRRTPTGLDLVSHIQPCHGWSNMIAGTYYYLQVWPGAVFWPYSPLGSYEVGRVIYNEPPPDDTPVFDPCPTCGVLDPGD